MKFEKKGVCHLNVYRRAGGDCSIRGISTKHDEIKVLVYRNAEGRLPNYVDVLRIAESVKDEHADDESVCLAAMAFDTPVAIPVSVAGRCMSGGNYAGTSNGVAHDLLGFPHPISIHDRVETPLNVLKGKNCR